MRKGPAVHRPLLAVATALLCWLLLASPARAEQAPGSLAALARAGAPLVAAATPASSGPALPARPPAASAAAPPAGQPATAPAIGIPGLPSPSDLLDGLDPREWAAAFLDGAVSVLGRELLVALRGFIDWALGAGGSSLNFVTRTPAQGSYESPTVRSLWDFSRAVANAGLALVVMWGGFNVVVRRHVGSPYHGAMELLPRVILAALASNLTLEFAGLLIEVNNAFAAAIGQVGLPGYEQANAAQEGMALVVVALAYAVMALLLVFQMLMRLALLDVLIVLSPLMVLCWVLPQTQGWTRWWAHLFPLTVFQQGVQLVVLRLGQALMVELAPGSVTDALLTLLLGIAIAALTLRVPSLLHGQVQHAGTGATVALVVGGRAWGAVAGRGSAAAGAAGR